MKNKIITSAGLPAVNWLETRGVTNIAIIIGAAWVQIGLCVVVFLAGLQSIPQEMYEAASIDGAGRFQKLLHVTLPGIMPTIITMLILRIGNLMSIGYEKTILLYNPSTYDTADIISSYVYRVGLLEQGWSYSTAIGLFNSVINLILLVLANKLSKKLADTSLW